MHAASQSSPRTPRDSPDQEVRATGVGGIYIVERLKIKPGSIRGEWLPNNSEHK